MKMIRNIVISSREAPGGEKTAREGGRGRTGKQQIVRNSKACKNFHANRDSMLKSSQATDKRIKLEESRDNETSNMNG